MKASDLQDNTITILKQKYNEYNELYFGGALPSIPIRWGNLKHVGAQVTFKTIGLKNGPRRIHDGSMEMVFSNKYIRSIENLLPILLHEMIHVYVAAVVGNFKEHHGTLFYQELSRIKKASGVNIPLTDKVEGLELRDKTIKPIGVVIQHLRDGRIVYALFSEKVLKEKVQDMKAQWGRYDNYEARIVTSEIWSAKAATRPLQRIIGYKTRFFHCSEAEKVDLLNNSEVIWSSHALTEAAVDPLPKKFWLVFDIPTSTDRDPDWQKRIDDKIDDIASGELKGLRGISSSREIITEWFLMARNAAVVMDAHRVAELNDIEQIHYDDPEWLCRRNCAALYRIWDKERGGKYRHTGMMQNLADYVIKCLPVNDGLQATLSYYGVATKIADVWQNTYEQRSINGVADLVEFFEDAWKDIEVNYRIPSNGEIDWTPATKKGLRKVGSLYHGEAEWLVNSPSFKIPEGSIMLLGINPDAAKHYEEWKANPDDPKFFSAKWSLDAYDRLITIIRDHKLKDHYDIRIIDGKRFEALRPTITSRRRKRV